MSRFKATSPSTKASAFLLITSACLLAIAAISASTRAAEPAPNPNAATAPQQPDLTADALSDDPAIASTAIAKLRAEGPAGLERLIQANHALVEAHRLGKATEGDPAEQHRWQRVSAAIDAVAAQKDAWMSGLYWYTDLKAAKQAAKESGKPILSLRLLGKLTDEFSCANSRFFRTVLYADRTVSQELSKDFILHWQSVRPVPKVTIDFGDGRVLERTITGNSIHYMLDSDGKVLDALPGLYSPEAFMRYLNEGRGLMRISHPPSGEAQLKSQHAYAAQTIAYMWQQDLKQIGAIAPPPSARTSKSPGANPTARDAAPLTMSKMAVERPMLSAMAIDQLSSLTTASIWPKIAELHARQCRLDSNSLVLMSVKDPAAMKCGQTMTIANVPADQRPAIVQNFERLIAQDTVYNEYVFHRQIHIWLSTMLPDGKSATDVDALNDCVYAKLFLTPSTDPWLGLVPPDTYSALPNDGIVAAPKD